MTDSKSLLNLFLEEHIHVVQNLMGTSGDEILEFSELAVNSLKAGGKVIWFGNGGSAADAQHMSAEFVGRFEKERRPLSSIALTVDTSMLTAIGNDYGFNFVFSRQIEALCRPEDLVVGISTSGNSPNVIEALVAAKKIGAKTVAMTGQIGGHVKDLVDVCVKVPSLRTARIQEAHILIGHVVCGIVDQSF